MSTIASYCGAKKALVASRMEHSAVVYGKGQFLQIDSDLAIAVVGAAEIDTKFFVLGHEMQNKSHISTGFSTWKQCGAEICIVPLSTAVNAERALYNRCTVTENNTDISLLLG